jgi:ribosome modulation factor
MSDKEHENMIQREGYRAFKAGKPRTSCPYREEGTIMGGFLYERLLRRWWLEGWDDAEKGAKDND